MIWGYHYFPKHPYCGHSPLILYAYKLASNRTSYQDLPAGWGGFRVRRGQIKRISLAIPWTKLYTGAVLVVEWLNFVEDCKFLVDKLH